MADVHAFNDVLQAFEDLTAAVSKAKTDGWKLGLGDLPSLWTMLSDIKTLVADMPDFKAEAAAAQTADWQALGARAVADVVGMLKAVVG